VLSEVYRKIKMVWDVHGNLDLTSMDIPSIRFDYAVER
jgi:hypothetical protein